MKRVLALFFSILAFLFFIPKILLANLGVGVGTGKIIIEEPLKSGIIYDFPAFTVLNTGDEASVYSIGISFRNGQEELKPDLSWFEFSGNDFYLNPGETKTITVKLNVPIKTIPGEYFCYLEASPLTRGKPGEASVGIAAASKVYFTIAPSNIFEGIYYRGFSLWKKYLPWTNITAGAVVVFVLIRVLGRFVHIEIGSKKGADKKEGSSDNEDGK